jgi:hypothetical protein
MNHKSTRKGIPRLTFQVRRFRQQLDDAVTVFAAKQEVIAFATQQCVVTATGNACVTSDPVVAAAAIDIVIA